MRQQKKLKIIFTTPQVLEQELRMPNSLLIEMAAEIGAKRIFVDGIGSLFPAVNGNGHTPTYRARLLPRISAAIA